MILIIISLYNFFIKTSFYLLIPLSQDKKYPFFIFSLETDNIFLLSNINFNVK